MSSRIVSILAWAWTALIVGSVVLTFGLGLREFEPIGALTGPLMAGLGALLVTRRPGNPIGFLLLLMATGYGIAFDDVVVAISDTPWGSGPAWVALLFAANLFTALYILPPVFLLLLFPTGRPPSPRWRWLLRAGLGFATLWVVLSVLSPSWALVDGSFLVDNPLVPYSSADLGPTAESIVAVAMTAGAVAFLVLSVISLIARYRNASAVERVQIRWLLYSATIFVATFTLLIVLSDNSGNSEPPVLAAIFYLSVLAIPVSIAIAILRHRLFDIDVIIRRTLLYGALTAILGGLYAGGVLFAQRFLEPLVGGADSPPVVIVTTLVVAALFNPLRVRVQRFIDRRFYRRKVDAERALDRFAALARSEVEIQEIREALFGVVAETLQPQRVGLWLRPPPSERGTRRER